MATEYCEYSWVVVKTLGSYDLGAPPNRGGVR